MDKAGHYGAFFLHYLVSFKTEIVSIHVMLLYHRKLLTTSLDKLTYKLKGIAKAFISSLLLERVTYLTNVTGFLRQS